MEFTTYRSKALKALWPKIEKNCGYLQTQICRLPAFSVWVIDDICAINWKHDNPIKICVNVLYNNIVDDVIPSQYNEKGRIR